MNEGVRATATMEIHELYAADTDVAPPPPSPRSGEEVTPKTRCVSQEEDEEGERLPFDRARFRVGYCPYGEREGEGGGRGESILGSAGLVGRFPA